MGLKITTSINSSTKIIKDKGLDNDGKVTRFLRDTVDRFSDPYIPMNVGNLKNNKTYPKNNQIKYNAPYAHYHYIGKKAVGASKPKGIKRTISNISMSYQGSPKRGAKWDKRMLNDRKQDIINDVENYMKNGG